MFVLHFSAWPHNYLKYFLFNINFETTKHVRWLKNN